MKNMLSDYKEVLQNKKFIYLWGSQVLSQLTINIMNFIFLIMLFEHTGSSIATSFLWVCYALPAVFVGPIAAGSADIIDRRKILIVTNFLQFLTIFLYAFFHPTSYFLAYGVVIVYSFLNQFYLPAESATLPSVLSKDELPHGNSLFFLTQQSALILGFGGAGILNSLLGFRNTLFLCSSLVFVAFVSVIFLPIINISEKLPQNFEQAFFSFFKKIIDGYVFIKNHRNIAMPIAALIFVQIFLAIIIVNVPSLAKNVIGINLNLMGILFVIPASLGALLASIIVPKLLKFGWRKKMVIQYAMMLAAISCFSVVSIFYHSPLSIKISLALLISLLMGTAFIGITIPSQTFLQEVVPGGMRGRVFGNFWFFVTVLSILPTIFSGTVSEILGIKTMFMLLGFIALSVYYLSRKFWH